MNAARAIRMVRYGMALAAMLALTLGGGTAAGLAVDSVLEIVMLIASLFTIAVHRERPASHGIVILVWASISVVVFQLLPVPAWLHAGQGVLPDATALFDPASAAPVLSLTPGRTLASLVWVLSFGLFLVALLRMPLKELLGLMPFLLMAIGLNFIVAFFQYTLKAAPEFALFTGISAQAGFFANANHFAAIGAMTVPLAALFFLSRGQTWLLLAVTAALMLVLFAAGSRFGFVAAGAAALATAALVVPGRRFSPLVLAGVVILCIAAVALAALRLSVEGLGDDVRQMAAATTWRAVIDNLPFGTGYGSFVTAFPAYEQAATIQTSFVNHAHNDYLELAMEGGIPAMALMAAFGVILVVRAAGTWKSQWHRALLVPVGIVLAHSLVDYPLRTFAATTLFVYVLALLFHDRSQAGSGASGTAHPAGSAAQHGVS